MNFHAAQIWCYFLEMVLLFSFIWTPLLNGIEVSEQKIRLLYNTMPANSVMQHLALYELYPNSPTGQQALNDALKLLSGERAGEALTVLPFLRSAIDTIVHLVNKQPHEESPELSESTLEALDRLTSKLPHTNLKGHYVWTESDVLQLDSKDIDLARGLFLSQLEGDDSARHKIRSYEAMLDLMALQIKAKLSQHASAEDKIKEMNNFIFFDMGFRFPPHSALATDIDIYSFLPSVIDSRKGVCLGVSILYLCLAQRLDLPLEIITPPGHIFVRYHQGNTVINIETTARGIHLDDEVYLGIDTKKLEKRTIKQTIGMAHFNQAAVFWQKNDYEKALKAYKKAQPYLPKDMTLKELMGYNLLLIGDLEGGKKLMEEVKDHIPACSISKQTVAEDYLHGNTDIEGIRAIFMFVDESRKSLLEKKIALESVLEKFPRFRAGWFSLAGTWLQLHRLGEALEALEKYRGLSDSDPSVEYYLAELYAQRMNYPKAWQHLKQTELLVKKANHSPKTLRDFRKKLSQAAPEYLE